MAKLLSATRYFKHQEIVSSREIKSDLKVCMVNQVDMTKAIQFRETTKIFNGTSPSYTALIAKAIEQAVKKHPKVNRELLGLPFLKKVHDFKGVHISVAVERKMDDEENLVYVSTIYDAQKKSSFMIDKELRALTSKPASADKRWNQYFSMLRLLPAQLSAFLVSSCYYSPKMWHQMRGGAFLISSPGKYGVDTLVGGWPWPVSFSFGILKDRPVVINGEVLSRPTLNLSMSFNRCLVAGAPAARFFNEIVTIIENGTFDGPPLLDKKLITNMNKSTSFKKKPLTGASL